MVEQTFLRLSPIPVSADAVPPAMTQPDNAFGPGGDDFTIRDEANAVTAFAFRNGFIEELHAGKWSPLLEQPGNSRITDDEMRRLMIEAAWHYRHRPRVGEGLRRRRQGQSSAIIAIADRAQHRLSRRFRHLTEQGKPFNKAVVAVARELVGFVWAALYPAAAGQAASDRP